MDVDLKGIDVSYMEVSEKEDIRKNNIGHRNLVRPQSKVTYNASKDLS